MEQEGREGVILLHGLARTRRSMRSMAASLQRLGYWVANAGYPSRRDAIERLADLALPPAVATLRGQGCTRLHAVTHSMGGIVLRSWLAANPLPEMGRVVMLSPPNQGSELVDFLRRFALFGALFGPAGRQLGTGPDSLPLRLGPMPCPVGIIIGNRPAPGLGRFFPGPNDGKVSLKRARLAGMTDFLVVGCGHSLIMNHREVQAQTAIFLRCGRFSREGER